MMVLNRRLTVCIALFLFPVYCTAQSMKWLVKAVSGEVRFADFSTSPPTLGPLITGYGLGAEEEVNIMTDASNNILFSTACNGSNIIQVRDANLNLMPNGTLRGSNTTFESAICKIPCTNDQYYFFNYIGPTGSDSLFYSIIDMSLNGGMGDVVQKNIYLGSGYVEGMTISHQMRNGCRWLIVPGNSNNNFTINAFKISHTGISSPIVLDSYPMTNTIMSPHEIELSMDNFKLVVSTFSLGNIDPDIILYDFDLENGAVSNRQLISVSPNWTLGIEFSPDASKIYYQTNTNTAGTSVLGRYDLVTGTNQIIDNSRDQYLTDPELAANGKIYIGWNYTNTYMSEIGDPNNPNVANIQYTRNAVFINGNGCRPGFPNFIDGEPPGTSITPTSIDFSYSATTNCGEYLFEDSSCLGSWWEWNFGDSTFSNAQNPIHQYASNGNYNVTLRLKVCADTLSLTKSISVSTASISLNVSPGIISCNNMPVTLSAFGGNTITWNPPTGLNTSSGNMVIANPAITTTYTVTASNGGSCSATATVTVSTVNASVSINSSATQGCNGDTITLVANTTGPIQWSNNSINDTIYVTQSGLYSVTMTDSGCIDVDSIAVTILFPSPVSINLMNTTPLCTNDTAHLQVIGSNLISQQWFYNNQPLVADTNTQIYVVNQGNYGVLATDFNGCTSTSSVQINLNQDPDARFMTTSQPCMDSLQFLNSSVDASMYYWYVDGLFVTSDTDPYIHFLGVGNHSVMLVAANGGCLDTLTQNIVTAPNAVADFYNDSTCSLTKRFFNTSLNGSQYTWTFENGATVIQTSPIHTFPSYGNYQIKLLVENQAGCKDSIEKSIEIVNHISSDFKYSLDTCANQLILIPTVTSGHYYYWNLGDSSMTESITTTHIYADPGNYSVTLITNENFNCKDITTQNITIPEIQSSHLFIPNAFTPNGDGLNETFEIFGLGQCDHYQLFIYNRWGQLIYEGDEGSTRWNGTYKNKIVESDVYSYLIKYNDTFETGMVLVLF